MRSLHRQRGLLNSGVVDWLLGGRWLSYTWATKPSAAGWTGRVIRISDVGATTAGSLWISDGTYWKPVNGYCVLGGTAVAVSTAADTNENIAFTYSVPLLAMGLNGALRVTSFINATNNGNAKTLRVRLGGVAGTDFASAPGITSHTNAMLRTMIQNRGAANSQYGATELGAASGNTLRTPVTGAIDTGAAQDLVITLQKAVGTDTTTLNKCLVELLVP